MMKSCERCGASFKASGGKRFCTTECRLTGECVICGVEFVRKCSETKTCSEECYRKLCRQVNLDWRNTDEGRRKAADCAKRVGMALRGRKRSTESIEKQRESIKNTISSMDKEARDRWNANQRSVTQSVEYRESARERGIAWWDSMTEEDKRAFGDGIRNACGVGTEANERRRETCLRNVLNATEEQKRVFVEAGIRGAKSNSNRFRTYGTSSVEKEIHEWLVSLGVSFERNDRTVLNGKEIDFYFVKHFFGIEFNGNWYHSVQGIMRLDKRYPTFSRASLVHQNKSLQCREQGIHLIHIWEWEWDDIRIRERIKSQIRGRLGLSKRIFARNCELREMSVREARDFFDLNSEFRHKNCLVYYGLYYFGECVMAYGVGYKQTGRGVDSTKLEISRSATKLDTVVVGGASRLCKRVVEWVRDEKPQISELHYFVDFDKHSGSSLEAMEFRFVKVSAPTLRIRFNRSVSDGGKVFVAGKVYGRQGSRHSFIKDQDKRGNLQTFANAGTLHYMMTL